ncbi:hypothetical protein BS47DRAFT_1134708 [Hydnum rufescens UP504]|uniref:RNB domain-containing protein n=1 Tax=Hydnum rufescens UP504 TaxID=1448309 RepID=A0A9P6DR62_9AGAM|nr:hypothetical protein BS47DRAFT_1134708 [Hydnum rufescens UP504]
MIAHGADGTEMNKRGLPLGPPGTSPMEILAESRSEKILELSVPVQVGDSHLTLIDGLDSIRHDFGQTPAFAIDDFDAKELDDAISIEPIPASNSYWVHVHVADPSSIIHPRDEIARIAEHRGVTAYFVERTWPMLPQTMTEALFSLGSTSLKTLAQPVLTFSYEVDEQGCIVQSKIRPALVRNVISLRYDDVDRFLNGGAQTKFLAYPLASGSPFSVPPSPIPEIAHEDIRHLGIIAQRLGKKRSSSERVLQWVSPHLKVFLHSTNLPINPLEPSRPSLYRGFPTAELGVEHIWESPARGASLPHTATEQDCAELMALRNGSGSIPLTEVFKRHIVFGRSIYTTEDMPHETMGVFSPDLYCRVTSPLRRFVDLVNHWQIKAALRNTLSPNALSFPPTATAPVPLFAKGMLDQLVVDHNHVDMAFKRASQGNMLAWAGNVMQNALADPTNEYAHHVLNNLDAVVMGTPVWANDIRASYLDVTLPQLGFNAAILDFDHNSPAQMGETLKARLHSVEVGMMPRVILKLV